MTSLPCEHSWSCSPVRPSAAAAFGLSLRLTEEDDLEAERLSSHGATRTDRMRKCACACEGASCVWCVCDVVWWPSASPRQQLLARCDDDGEATTTTTVSASQRQCARSDHTRVCTCLPSMHSLFSSSLADVRVRVVVRSFVRLVGVGRKARCSCLWRRR